MNKNLNDKIIQVKKLIGDSSLVKEYNFYSDLFCSSQELKQLDNEIKFIKKCNMTEEERHLYHKLTSRYNAHPIVNNYNNLKNDIDDFKLEVKNIVKI